MTVFVEQPLALPESSYKEMVRLEEFKVTMINKQLF